MQWMKAEFSQRRIHEKIHEKDWEKMEMEDPDPVVSLFYIWQFSDSCFLVWESMPGGSQSIWCERLLILQNTLDWDFCWR